MGKIYVPAVNQSSWKLECQEMDTDDFQGRVAKASGLYFMKKKTCIGAVAAIKKMVKAMRDNEVIEVKVPRKKCKDEKCTKSTKSTKSTRTSKPVKSGKKKSSR